MQPISPSEAARRKFEAIPPEVIQAVNELIVENLQQGRAIILQKEIIERAQRRGLREPKQLFYDRHWLDFEAIFETAGWSVKYDKPAYNEDYDAYFEFKY